jgi:hypothetical protein
MSVQKMKWAARETLIRWGMLPEPKRTMRRRGAGVVRERLQGRGAYEWNRRITLAGILRDYTPPSHIGIE